LFVNKIKKRSFVQQLGFTEEDNIELLQKWVYKGITRSYKKRNIIKITTIYEIIL